MNEFIHWPKPCLVLLATRDGILSGMIDFWMQNHLVSDNDHNIVNLRSLNYFYKERQKMFGDHLVFVTLHHNFQLVLSKIFTIGDTKYHI